MRRTARACLLFVLLAALPFVNGGCNGTKVVVFSGMPRGNVELWRSTVERLIKPNALDVIFDLWTPPNKSKAELLDVFGPYLCTYFEEEYSLEWKAALVKRYPAFQLRPAGKAAQVWVNENPVNSVHMVDAFYRLAHANELLARYHHRVVMRARLDTLWKKPLILSDNVQPNSVYVPAVGRSGHCGEHQHDQFAYGDFWGMRNYFDVFPVMHYLHAEMKRNPRYYSGKGPLPANQTSVMAPTTEKYLGHRLMLSNTKCLQFPEPAPYCCTARGPKNREDFNWNGTYKC